MDLQINNVIYPFSSIELAVNGQRIQGFSSIEYGIEVAHANIYMQPTIPVAIHPGGIETYSPVKIEMLQDEAERMIQALGPGFMYAQSTLVVSYAPSLLGRRITDVIAAARITKMLKAINNQQGYMIVPLEMMAIVRMNVR